MRTEGEILKSFEEIGLEVIKNDKEEMVLRSTIQKFRNDGDKYTLTIDKKEKYVFHKDDCAIGFDELKLLNELFLCWSWI